VLLPSLLHLFCLLGKLIIPFLAKIIRLGEMALSTHAKLLQPAVSRNQQKAVQRCGQGSEYSLSLERSFPGFLGGKCLLPAPTRSLLAPPRRSA